MRLEEWLPRGRVRPVVHRTRLIGRLPPLSEHHVMVRIKIARWFFPAGNFFIRGKFFVDNFVGFLNLAL